MAACLRVCLQSTLKILNSVMGLLGMAMIMYSIWMIRSCLRQIGELSRGFSESSSSPSWFELHFAHLILWFLMSVIIRRLAFDGRSLTLYLQLLRQRGVGRILTRFIFAFLGLGIFLCVLTCSGHIAAETINGHCLSCYATTLVFLLMLEAAITADIFLNRNWEKAIPHDPTGRFNQFKEFVRSNSGLCKWIGLLIVAVQALSIVLSMVLRALGPDQGEYDESDDDSLPARLPLLKNQAHITHTADRKFLGNNDSRIVQIDDTVSR